MITVCRERSRANERTHRLHVMASADGAKRKRAGRASRRPPRSETTLACFIQALQGRRVVVELRNDVIIRGCLEEADDFMKCGRARCLLLPAAACMRSHAAPCARSLTMAQVVYQTINVSCCMRASMRACTPAGAPGAVPCGPGRRRTRPASQGYKTQYESLYIKASAMPSHAGAWAIMT